MAVELCSSVTDCVIYAVAVFLAITPDVNELIAQDMRVDFVLELVGQP